MRTAEILAAFPRYSVLVCGDVCLARLCVYDPAAAEPSRETRIPRLGVISTEFAPGAGGTVANNLAALGIGRVAVLGVIGNDGFAWELTRSLNSRAISTDLLVRSSEIPTFTYTQLVNAATGVEDHPRVHHIYPHPFPPAAQTQILGYLEAFPDNFHLTSVPNHSAPKHC